jgi:uncharacterized membrane protein
MNSTRTLINAAVVGVIAWGLTGCSEYVAAVKKEQALAKGFDERCYGVARAGSNDCKTATTVCAGWSSEDRDPTAYIYLPKGTCEKIVGGSPTSKS